MRPWVVLHIVLTVAACDHGAPFAHEPDSRSGPFRDLRPLQLTYNPGVDRIGTPWADSLVYTAFLPDGDGCLATMPQGGGVAVLACPDTNTISAWSWIEPAVSPDGRRIAYVEERRSSPTALLVAERRLVVAPRDRPAEATTLIDGSFVDGAGVRVNVFRRLLWVDDDRIRFLGDSVGSGTLAVQAPVGIYDVRPSDAAVTRLPGGMPLAWARDGLDDWVITADDPQGLYVRGADGALTHVFDVQWNALAIAVADGRPLVLEVRPPMLPGAVPDTLLDLYDVASGAVVGSVPTGEGTPHDVRAVPGRRALVIQSGRFGAANLWLVEVP